MLQPFIKTTTTSFACPDCKKQMSNVDHLKPGARAGPWYCDGCGQGWNLEMRNHGVELTGTDKRKVDTLVTLEIPPEAGPITLIVQGMRFENLKAGDEGIDHHRYHYEEGTCPTNYLRQIQKIIVDGDDDPHGIASYVSERDMTDEDKANGY